MFWLITSRAIAKQFLAKGHKGIDLLQTVYCGCPWSRTTRSGGDVDRDACGLKARKNDKRSDRIEWEHVVPASWFGKPLACWKLKEDAYSQCKGLSGRKCCQKVSRDFARAHNDPNNLFPSSGEINGDRSNHPFGTVPGEPRVYGTCDFEIGRNRGSKVAEPPQGPVRGVLARAMLYMAETYGVDIRLPPETVRAWHRENPPQPWEISRARRIAAHTGLQNRWVLGKE